MLLFLFIVTKFLFYLSLCTAVYLFIIWLLIQKRKRSRKNENTKVVSFLHPFCNDCGGGEKVLWMMVQALKELKSKAKDFEFRIQILAGIPDDAQRIMSNLESRFEIKLAENQNLDIEIIRLKKANLTRPQNFMTMILQILGQIVFAFEILTKVHSDVIIDTTGMPFTYWVFSLIGGTRVIAYVHYPFISEDMIADIESGQDGVHSRGNLSKLPGFKKLKVLYYKLILALYRWNGKFVVFQMSNSTWTFSHMKKIWPDVKREKLYPPCSTELYKSTTESSKRSNIIVSFAQFRPEKRHKMQVNIFQRVKNMLPNVDIKFHIVGSTRDEADLQLLKDLQDYINKQGLGNEILLRTNLPLVEVTRLFSNAKFGIHTMRDEHFGISIIEMMASGLVTIAHNSAGPKHDIIGDSKTWVGVLAECKFY
jgi:alpha-1,2-mannosyltransferase